MSVMQTVWEKKITNIIGLWFSYDTTDFLETTKRPMFNGNITVSLGSQRILWFKNKAGIATVASSSQVDVRVYNLGATRLGHRFDKYTIDEPTTCTINLKNIEWKKNCNGIQLNPVRLNSPNWKTVKFDKFNEYGQNFVVLAPGYSILSVERKNEPDRHQINWLPA